MANDVKVVIKLATAPGRVSFGTPLLLAGKQDAPVAYTVCSSLAAVKTAGFAETTETYKAAQLLFMQANAPAQIAVYGSTAAAVTALEEIWHKDWRQLVVTSLSEDGESTIKEISDYVEGRGEELFFCHVASTGEAAALQGNERTVCMLYSEDDAAYPEAALVGATAGLTVGSFTYKNMVLKGITPHLLKDDEIEAAHESNLVCFVTKAGDNVTSEGKTLSGEYIDIVDSKDYIIQNIEYRCQKVLNTVGKLPYDDNGIAALEGETLSVLMDAYGNGMIGMNDEGEPDYSVNFLSRAQVPAGDRTSRKYNGGSFTFGLAGAIHNAEISGEIIV